MGFINYLPNYLVSIFISNLFFIGCVLFRYGCKCLYTGKIISIKEYYKNYDDYFSEFVGGLNMCLCGIITLFYIIASCSFIN